MKTLLIVTCCIASVALILGIVLITHVMWPTLTAAVVTATPIPAAETKPSAAMPPSTPLPAAVPDPPKPKNPAIMLIVETTRENHAWVNYWDGEGVQRGVHVVCPVAQSADQSQRNMSILSDLLRLGITKGLDLPAYAKLGKDLRPAEAPKPGACQVLKRTWHFVYGGNGRLEMVEGSANLGPVNMPN